jgi:hypothetical protein
MTYTKLYVTGKVLTKRDGSFKTFQYDINGKVLRKSRREYSSAWHYRFSEQREHWTFGKKPDSFYANHSNVHRTTQFPVVWEVTEEQEKLLSESARIGVCGPRSFTRKGDILYSE